MHTHPFVLMDCHDFEMVKYFQYDVPWSFNSALNKVCHKIAINGATPNY
jgi:hypothetical protein